MGCLPLGRWVGGPDVCRHPPSHPKVPRPETNSNSRLKFSFLSSFLPGATLWCCSLHRRCQPQKTNVVDDSLASRASRVLVTHANATVNKQHHCSASSQSWLRTALLLISVPLIRHTSCCFSRPYRTEFSRNTVTFCQPVSL